MASGASVHDDPRFAPFTRSDRYGHMGRAPQPAAEQARLVFMSIFIVPIKALLGVLCLVLCHLTCRVADLLPASWRGTFCAATGKFWCRTAAVCFGLNVRWVKVSDAKGSKVKAAGLISNHCSWADILIHLGRNWCSFAAREGTQNLPLIGYISMKIQCVYVNRDKKESTSQGVSAQIKERMVAKSMDPTNNDRLMLLFPEGTTTNGRFLLPFKTGAFLAGVPLQPVLMKYDDQSPLSPTWDTINIWRHVWLLLCQPYHNITCYEIPVYDPSEEERKNPALYAENMRQYMLKYSKMQPSESTFATKMEYHAMVIKGQQPPADGKTKKSQKATQNGNTTVVADSR